MPHRPPVGGIDHVIRVCPEDPFTTRVAKGLVTCGRKTVAPSEVINARTMSLGYLRRIIRRTRIHANHFIDPWSNAFQALGNCAGVIAHDETERDVLGSSLQQYWTVRTVANLVLFH